MAAVAAMSAPRPASRELDDLTLARARRREASACTRFVACYQDQVFAVLARILGPVGKGPLVEDLAQETFVRALEALPRFDPAGPARLSTWVLTIATRRALTELRRRGGGEPLEAIPEHLAASEAHGPERIHARRDLARAVAELTPQQRAVFVLRDVHGLSEAEVAEALELEPAAVKSRLHRARSRLRTLLKGHRHD